MCCEPCGAEPDDGPEGECPECQSKTYGGDSVEICSYSPEQDACETCGCNPCSQYC